MRNLRQIALAAGLFTLALAGALANLLHQLHSKRPNVNAPLADMLTEPRPPAPTTADATAE